MDLDGLGACTALGRRERRGQAPSAWRDISANDVPTGSDAVAPLRACQPSRHPWSGDRDRLPCETPTGRGWQGGVRRWMASWRPPHLRPPATCRPPRPAHLVPVRCRLPDGDSAGCRAPQAELATMDVGSCGSTRAGDRRRWSRRTRLPSRPRRRARRRLLRLHRRLVDRRSGGACIKRSIVPARRAALPRCYAIESCRARDAVG